LGVAGKLEMEVRNAQKSYWEDHSKNLNVEAMMLDSYAADLEKEERLERRNDDTTHLAGEATRFQR
jgi:phosphoethanolamine N-methyltransferase